MNNLARKCDRCGNFYLLDDWDFWMNVTTSTGERKSIYVTNPDDGVAICQDCQKSFVTWWNSLSKENEHG